MQKTDNENELYQGWTNRETWLVIVWLGNDEWLYKESQAIAGRAKGEYEAAQELEALVVDRNPLIEQASLYSDLLNQSLSRVNWREIANSLNEE